MPPPPTNLRRPPSRSRWTSPVATKLTRPTICRSGRGAARSRPQRCPQRLRSRSSPRGSRVTQARGSRRSARRASLGARVRPRAPIRPPPLTRPRFGMHRMTTDAIGMTTAESVNGKDHDLDWLLENLKERTPSVQHVLVLSKDGLRLCFTQELNIDKADQLSAIASGIQSLTLGASAEFGRGLGWGTSLAVF